MNFENIEPLPVICRQSSMTCAISCERKWFCKYRMEIELRGEPLKVSASLGKIYHKFHELGQGHEQEVKAWVQQMQTELMDRVNRGEDLDGSIARQATMLTELYNKARVMAELFWEKYPQPSYFTVIGKEIKHTMEYDGLTIEGTIDKLLLNEQDGSIWIRDHKSTGRPLAFLFGGISWSIQARVYRILAFDYMTEKSKIELPSDLKIQGFILDGILNPGIKLCKADQKNAKDWNVPVEEAYLRRVKDWYKDNGEDGILSRGIFYTEDLVPIELKNRFDRMRELSMRPIKPEYYSRDITRKACSEWERQCEYHDLCSVSESQWDRLFESKYRFAGETSTDESDN